MPKKNEIILVCKQVKYYSPNDETAFFEWIKKIKSINEINGKGDELYLHVTSKRISNRALDELIALFYRYKVDMEQLAIFLNNKNKEWFFDNKYAYWHRKVFGDKNTQQMNS